MFLDINPELFQFDDIDQDDELLGENDDPILEYEEVNEELPITFMEIGLEISFKEIELIHRPMEKKKEIHENFYLNNIRNHHCLSYLYYKYHVFKNDTFVLNANKLLNTIMFYD